MVSIQSSRGVDSGVLDLSTRDHFIHDYNQIKSYKWYCRMFSSNRRL